MREYSVGIDIGGTKILMVLIDEDGKIYKKGFLKIGNTDEGDRILNDIKKVFLSLIEGFEIKSIGVGCAGFIDYKSGFVKKSPNINFLVDYPLKEVLERTLNYPVFIDNDVKMGAIGEMFFGEGKDSEFFIFITLGTGIGGALVYKNKILRGMNNLAGEIGHITLDKEGVLCGCGKKGCFEKLSSGGAIRDYVIYGLKMGRESKILERVNFNIEKIDTPLIMDLAFEGDSLCVEAVKNATFYIGLVTSYLINILNPEKIIFGGGLTYGLGFFFDDIIKISQLYSLKLPFENTKILKSKLKEDAISIGAAIYSLKKLRGEEI
ncbi:MAG: ROK family protein [Caldisericia bacterium]|jgi:glucokinase|nr:ROK family protein [Caldisericia bacterium]